jgi:hypothetical protein
MIVDKGFWVCIWACRSGTALDELCLNFRLLVGLSYACAGHFCFNGDAMSYANDATNCTCYHYRLHQYSFVPHLRTG